MTFVKQENLACFVATNPLLCSALDPHTTEYFSGTKDMVNANVI